MSEEINQNVEQQPTTQPADNGNQDGGKMFTQEEVNKIVSDRLTRDREKRSAQQQEDAREQALKAREARLDCREYLTEKKYPAELLDILDTTDADKFKATADKLGELFGHGSTRAQFVQPRFTGPRSGGASPDPDPIREAFMPKT